MFNPTHFGHPLPRKCSFAICQNSPCSGQIIQTFSLYGFSSNFGRQKVVVRHRNDESIYGVLKNNDLLPDFDFYVQVVYETDANNVPTDTLKATLITKGLNYTSEAKFKDISISKNVTGDIADKNAYFEFNINLTGTQIHNGDTFTITGQSKDGAQTTCVVGTSCKVFLKHGESAIIKNLPIGSKYTITEAGATDYKTYIDGSSNEDSDKTCDEKTISATGNNTTAFVNNKESTTLTGIFINIAPFVILLILSIGGIYTIRKTAKNN